MSLMVVLGLMLTIGLGLTVRWGSEPYLVWRPGDADPDSLGRSIPSVPDAAKRYLRGAAVGLVAGVWAGAMVTGPAMRLIMRLLAATAGDGAQGRLTEAQEIVGKIDLGGTLGLLAFGGVLPGLVSGFSYVLVRRWLPTGRLGGIVFGLLHLVIGATRIDPLRPENVDFGVVGPGWLAVLTFGLASVAHGMAIAAIANRFSQAFPSGLRSGSKTARAAVMGGLALPVLFLIPGAFLLVPLGAGMVFAIGWLRLRDASVLARSPFVTRLGRVAGVAVALAFLPWTVMDLVSVATEPQTTRGLPHLDSRD